MQTEKNFSPKLHISKNKKTSTVQSYTSVHFRHVDDTGFWPATSDAPGVNAWIALDDMPIERGGGFALAVGSHTAPWREAAYNVTGSTHTFPEEGFSSAADMLKNRIGNGTCNIKTSANHLHRRMEDVKRVYDIKKGDVIFHHRFLFHRSIPFKRDAIEKRISRNDEQLLYRRYSIRYGPGHSKIPKGWGTEMSVLWDSKNGKQFIEKSFIWGEESYPHLILFISFFIFSRSNSRSSRRERRPLVPNGVASRK